MSKPNLFLAPMPKKIELQKGSFRFGGRKFCKIESDSVEVRDLVERRFGEKYLLTASPKVPSNQVEIVIREEHSGIPAEGYRLEITSDGMRLSASAPAGFFYGFEALEQIRRQFAPDIPCMTITDSPDFPDRGVTLDISRDKVPTVETLYHLVDVLSSLKINQLQLYTEHTFAYFAHPDAWKDADPITGDDILKLDAYCRSKFIELVPNQNSFGHMERWLKHDRYRHLAEAPDGCDTEWGRFDYPLGLCPVDERSIEFLAGLYDELLPHFTSSLFNVDCDETIELGRGRSRQVCEEYGVGRVYLDFLLKIYNLVAEHGRRMMFAGDIIIRYPELISELPKDVIALEWGYECDHPFKKNCEKFRESGVPFYVWPGTSSWLTLAGRTDNALVNISSAASNGLKQGAVGMLTADWGDWGHWQPLSVSYLGYLAGASASWNAETPLDESLAQSLSVNIFDDATGKVGRTFYELGNLYRVFKKRTYNSSVPFQVLFWHDRKETFEGLTIGEFDEMMERIDDIEGGLSGHDMKCRDAAVVESEIEHVIKMLRLAADYGRWRLGGRRPDRFGERINEIKKEHEKVWLMRNRLGGLSDSTARWTLRDE